MDTQANGSFIIRRQLQRTLQACERGRKHFAQRSNTQLPLPDRLHGEEKGNRDGAFRLTRSVATLETQTLISVLHRFLNFLELTSKDQDISVYILYNLQRNVWS